MSKNTQNKLTKTRNSLPISLLRTRELIMEEVRPMLKRHEITEQQWRVLRVIGEEESLIDATTIADKACMLAPSLTRILRTLSERGFVTIVKDETDGRRLLVELSKNGEEFIEKITPESVELFKKLRTVVGEERWEALVELLTDIRDDMKNAKENQSKTSK